MHKTITILIIYIVFSNFLIHADVFDDIKNSYDLSVYQWINEEKTDDNFLRTLSSLEMDLDLLSESRNKYYWLSSLNLMSGFVHFRNENTAASLIKLEKSRELADNSLAYGDYSEGWRLLSEAGSYIMLQKGVGYIIANSGKVQEQAEKSLELDSDNYRAALIEAQGLLNAPAIFGGNKKKGIKQLEELGYKDDLSYEDQYFIMLALSDAYITLKRNDDAIRNYRMMLSLFPENSFIEKKMEELF